MNFSFIFLEHIKISRRAFSKFCKNTYYFREEKNTIRIYQIFQESFLKIPQEYIRFSRRKKYNKNRSTFPGECSQNFVGIDTIFQKTIPLRTDILQNCLVGCFRLNEWNSMKWYILGEKMSVVCGVKKSKIKMDNNEMMKIFQETFYEMIFTQKTFS